MNTSDDPSFHDEIHQGHDLELGILQRLRDWTDVFPWSRLARTTRLAASPPHLVVSALCILLWHVGCSVIGIGATHMPGNDQSIPSTSETQPEFAVSSSIQLWEHLQAILAGVRVGDTGSWLAVGWTLILLPPLVIMLARQGALLTAGRPLMTLRQLISHTLKRVWYGWLAILVPAVCVVVFSLPLFVLGWLGHLVATHSFLEMVLAAINAIIVIPAGMLGFGALFAIPLSWAAITNEPDPDPLDSLSRGYESLYRRPLQLAAYSLISTIMLVVVVGLAWGVAEAAAGIATGALSLSGCPESISLATGGLVRQIPHLVFITMAASLIGGVYLLVRYDTGGQEVEDVWAPASGVDVPLPELPTT